MAAINAGPLGSRIVRRLRMWNPRLDRSESVEHHLVDLVPIDPQRQRPAKIGRPYPRSDFRVNVVGLVRVETDVVSSGGRPEEHLVSALFGVRLQERQVAQLEGPGVGVRLTRHRPEDCHVAALHLELCEGVRVGKLVAGRVHLEEVRVPIEVYP